MGLAREHHGNVPVLEPNVVHKSVANNVDVAGTHLPEAGDHPAAVDFSQAERHCYTRELPALKADGQVVYGD